MMLAEARDAFSCPHCGESVPPGTYCGNCGAHLADQDRAHRKRDWAFAAAPHEHVVQLSVISTLFPHLPHRHSHAFRRALGAGLVLVVLLAALGLYAAATLSAALVLPILYLLYLYDVEVYEHEPVSVVAATFVVGAALGVAGTLLSNRLLDGSGFANPSVASVLVGGVLVPVIGQVLMVLGPLLLLNRRHFNESLDGLAFGVSSAFGYSMAMMLVVLGPAITSTPLAASPLDWGTRIVREGFFVFTVNAAATAAITASLWLARHQRNRNRHQHWIRGLPAIIIAAFIFQILLGVGSSLLTDLLQETAVWAVGAVIGLLWLRFVIHNALLEEGDTFAVGADAVCSECHHVVPTMLFCPHCGVARSASPKVRVATQVLTAEVPA
jgi:MFS family permease